MRKITIALSTLALASLLTVVGRAQEPERIVYKLTGKVGAIPVRMELVRYGDNLSGGYVYESSKTALHAVVNGLSVEGVIDKQGQFTLDETANNWETDSKSGRFKGTLVVEGGSARITGTWSKPDGSKPLPFALSDVVSGPAGSRVEARKWNESDPVFKKIIDATYPHFAGGSNPKIAALNIAVEGLVARLVKEYREGVAEDDPIPAELLERLSFEARYEVTAATADLVSILFTVYVDYGGAHPAGYSSSLNFDLRSGTPLTLATIFKDKRGYLQLLSTKTATVAEREFHDSLNPSPDPESYEAWYLTPNGLTVAFSVAHVFGDTAEVYYPFAELRPSLDQASPVGSLLK